MSNRFDEKYDIRLARYDEIAEIMSFIDLYWKKDHILAKDKSFFEYEMVVDGNVNFVIAKTKKDNLIEGVLGFLPCSKDEDNLDLWGVIWKTIPDAMPLLGIELKKRLMLLTGARTELGVGANPNTAIPLLKRLCHYYTGKMKHYYRLSDCNDFIVANVKTKNIPEIVLSEDISIKSITDYQRFRSFGELLLDKKMIPYKDLWYYKRRFFEHPIYKYEVWGISQNVKKAIMITRQQNYKNVIVTRIVDYLGDQSLFSGCGRFFDEILATSEYIDFYFDGFNENYVRMAGMIEVDDGEGNIIPDYFYPFERQNVDIYVDSSNNTHRCLFYKADGDQDRPN